MPSCRERRWGPGLAGRPAVPCLVIAAIVAGVALAALSTTAAGTRRAAAQEEPGARAEGAGLYRQLCAGCHGADAQGSWQAPPLVGVSAASVHFMLSTGRMPIDEPDEPIDRSDPLLEPDEIDSVLAYLEPVLAPPGVPEVDLADGDLGTGAELYLLHCASCHGSLGVGGGIVDVNPVPNILDATPVQTAEAILTGPTTMPRFAPDVLSERELASVVRYVQYLQQPEDPGGVTPWRLGTVGEGAIAWVAVVALVVLGPLLLGRRPSGSHRGER